MPTPRSLFVQCLDLVLCHLLDTYKEEGDLVNENSFWKGFLDHLPQPLLSALQARSRGPDVLYGSWPWTFSLLPAHHVKFLFNQMWNQCFPSHIQDLVWYANSPDAPGPPRCDWPRVRSLEIRDFDGSLALALGVRPRPFSLLLPKEHGMIKELLTSAKNVVSLSLVKFCTDDFLGVIGRNCRHLEHLDVSLSHTVTDAGMMKLTGCGCGWGWGWGRSLWDAITVGMGKLMSSLTLHQRIPHLFLTHAFPVHLLNPVCSTLKVVVIQYPGSGLTARGLLLLYRQCRSLVKMDLDNHLPTGINRGISTFLIKTRLRVRPFSHARDMHYMLDESSALNLRLASRTFPEVRSLNLVRRIQSQPIPLPPEDEENGAPFWKEVQTVSFTDFPPRDVLRLLRRLAPPSNYVSLEAVFAPKGMELDLRLLSHACPCLKNLSLWNVRLNVTSGPCPGFRGLGRLHLRSVSSLKRREVLEALFAHTDSLDSLVVESCSYSGDILVDIQELGVSWFPRIREVIVSDVWRSKAPVTMKGWSLIMRLCPNLERVGHLREWSLDEREKEELLHVAAFSCSDLFVQRDASDHL